jgi:hypothetical protein
MILSDNPTLIEIVDELERVNSLIIDRGGEKTVVPSSTDQVLHKGNYKGDIIVKGDSNLVPSNIKNCVSIFGVNGTLKEPYAIPASLGNALKAGDYPSLNVSSSTWGNWIETEYENISFSPIVNGEFRFYQKVYIKYAENVDIYIKINGIETQIFNYVGDEWKETTVTVTYDTNLLIGDTVQIKYKIKLGGNSIKVTSTGGAIYYGIDLV